MLSAVEFVVALGIRQTKRNGVLPLLIKQWFSSGATKITLSLPIGVFLPL